MTTPSDLTADLRALPHPATPPDLTGIVMARIAQLEEARTAGDAPAIPDSSGRPDWSFWISVGGLGAGLVIAMLSFPAPTGITSLGRGGPMAGLTQVSSAPMATVALVAGFAIYLVSLFLPVRER